MLQNIRNGFKGPLALVTVAILILPFALFGINYYFTDTNNLNAINVASVNGTDVTQQEFLNLYSAKRTELEKQNKTDYDDAAIRKEILDKLLEDTALVAWGKKNNFVVLDKNILDLIHTQEEFQEDGKFSPDKYFSTLERYNMDAAVYEKRLYKYSLEEQIKSFLQKSSFIIDNDLNSWLTALNQMRVIDYLEVTKDDFLDEVKIEDSEIADYYEKNKNNFIENSKISLSYVLIDKDKISQQVKITDADSKQYYEDNKDLYNIPTRRRVSHILFKASNSDEYATALERAQKIRQKLVAGADFATTAQQYSDDITAKTNKGDLGFISEGSLGDEFERISFSLNLNEVSEPLKSDAGYQIIKVTAIENETLDAKQQEELNKKVAQDYKSYRANTEYYQTVDSVKPMAFEEPDLKNIAQLAKVGVKTTKTFSPNNIYPESKELSKQEFEIFSNPKVKEILDDSKFINNKNNSELIELNENQAVVLRVNQYAASRFKTLDEVKQDIVENIKAKKANTLANKKSNDIMDFLDKNSERDFSDLEQELKQQFKVAKLNKDIKVSQRNSDLPQPLIEDLFALPNQGLPLVKLITTFDKNFIVVFKSVEQNPSPIVSADIAKNILETSYSRLELQLFAKDLLGKANITTNENYKTLNY